MSCNVCGNLGSRNSPCLASVLDSALSQAASVLLLVLGRCCNHQVHMYHMRSAMFSRRGPHSKIRLGRFAKQTHIIMKLRRYKGSRNRVVLPLAEGFGKTYRRINASLARKHCDAKTAKRFSNVSQSFIGWLDYHYCGRIPHAIIASLDSNPDEIADHITDLPTPASETPEWSDIASDID